jgi:hypothetical protein
MTATINNLEMLGFCLSNTFDPTRSGTTITGIIAEDFMTQINQKASLELGTVEISDEYPEICRHFFVKNDFTTTLQGVVKVSDGTPVVSEMVTRGGREDIEEAYEAHWVEAKNVEVPKAEFLDVILYSREHLKDEGITIDGDWGVVTVLGVPTCEQTPPTRTTIERNSAGTDAGGNGIEVTASLLSKSDAYWYPTGTWINVK